MPNVRRTPLRTAPDSGRRPVRPIDREKMRPWLVRILDQARVPGVRWVDVHEEIFEIPWRHAARQGWSIEKDACIFELWAVHTRKYIAGKDKEKDPKRWKANFRCALNSLPDVERVKGISSKGSQAVRQYRFKSLDNKLKITKVRKQRSKKIKDESDDYFEEVDQTPCPEEGTPAIEEEETIPSPTSIPNFEQLLPDSEVVQLSVSSHHMSGCHILQRGPAPPTSTPSCHPPRPLTPDSVHSLSDSEMSYYSEEETMHNLEVILKSEFDLNDYHPSLWTVGMDIDDVANHVEISHEEEVASVITLDCQPEYWDLSRNSLSCE